MSIPELTINNSFSKGTSVSYDGTSIEYVTGGDGERVLLFIHGWTCDKSFWAAQLEFFANRYRVIALDLPGHGSSPTDRTTLTVQDLVRDVVTFVQTLKLENVVLIGHSLGGALALDSSIELGRDIVKPIAVDSLVYPSTYGVIPEDILVKRVNEYRNDFRKEIRATMTGFFSDNARSTLVETVASQSASAPFNTSVSLLESLFRWNVFESLAKITEKVDCVCSQSIYETYHSDELSKYFNIVTVPDVGHFCMLEDPGAVNRTIAGFLEAM